MIVFRKNSTHVVVNGRRPHRPMYSASNEGMSSLNNNSDKTARAGVCASKKQ